MKVELTEAAMDVLHIRVKSGCKVLQKILSLLEEIAQTPYSGRGRPEQLRHELSSYCSRCINTKDRIIYRVDEDTTTIHIIGVKRALFVDRRVGTSGAYQRPDLHSRYCFTAFRCSSSDHNFSADSS